jgi:aerobic carbon-monoxide dehydrogenase medium subunit
MYTAEFTYHKASSVADALSMLKANPEAKLLAGGHSLIPAMKLKFSSPPALIDLSKVSELKGIRLEGGAIVIGAMTTHREIEFSELLKKECAVLPQVAALIGDPMVRNKGTIGGALAHADPAADYPAIMLALGASFKIQSGDGSRVVSADDFFTGMYETAVKSGELLTEIHIPTGARAAYEKFPHPASRYAVVGVAVAVRDGAVMAALTGAGEHVSHLTKLEGEGTGSACQGLVNADSLIGDGFASAEYRAHLVDVMAKRALERVKS